MSIKPLIYDKTSPEELRNQLLSLKSPNRLPVRAIEGAVTSVNGMTGDVVIEGATGQYQPVNETLMALSSADLSSDGMLWGENGEFFMSPVSRFMKSLMAAPNEEYYRSLIGLGDAAILDKNVPFGIPTLDEDGKIPSEMLSVEMATVAQSGSYNDLTDKPEIFSGSYNDLTDKPAIFDGSYNSLTDTPLIFSGDYSDLENKPSLFDGSYTSLTNLPDLFDGDYNSLSNKPIIPVVSYPVTSVNKKSGDVSLDYTDVGAAAEIHTHSLGDITGLQDALDSKMSKGASIPYTSLSGAPVLSKSAISGSYNDLTNRPELFSGNYADLINKPSLFDGTWASLTGKPTFSAVSQTGNYNDLIDKPVLPTTTNDITERNNLYYTDARVAKYLSGNGFRKVETLQGVTNSSGVYQVTFATPYATPPHVNPVIINGTGSQVVLVSNLTTTGCTISVVQRAAVTLLGLEVLLAATNPVNNATVAVLVVAKA